MLLCFDQRTGAGCGAFNRNDAETCAGCGASLRYALPLHTAGAIVGAYRVVRVIGIGGFGAVYAAQKADADAPVALKEIFDPAGFAALRDEFEVISRLRHPGLPRYHEVFESDGRGYLIMDLVDGPSLEEILARRGEPLGQDEALRYAEQLCDALGYLHTRQPPVIHRDVKPANIRLSPDGRARLVDFGMLKHGDGTTRSTRLGLTPAYAPIEQYAGRTDPRTDIYSLGAMLYHLLTGQEPPPAPARVVAADPLPAIETMNPAVAPHVAAAIHRALAPRPDDRFPSAEELLRALRGELDARPHIPSTRTTLAIDRPRSSNPYRTWVAGALALFFLIFALAALAGTRSNPLPRPEPVAAVPGVPSIPRALAEGRFAQTQPTDVAALTGATLPRGTIAYLTSDGESPMAIYAIDLPGGRPRRLSAGGATCQILAWSPDGRRLACSVETIHQTETIPEQRYHIAVMDADGGDLRVVASDIIGQRPAWSPDGRFIAYAVGPDTRQEPGLYAVEVESGAARRLSATFGEWVAWSPDGAHVALATGDPERQRIAMVTVDTGVVRQLTTRAMPAYTHLAWSPDSRRLAFVAPLDGGYNLHVMDIRTRDTRQLTTSAVGEASAPSWSPDGRRILFSGDTLYTVGVDTGDIQPLVAAQVGGMDPRWSPDGRWVVFVANESGSFEIAIVPATGGSADRLTYHELNDFGPAWRPAISP